MQICHLTKPHLRSNFAPAYGVGNCPARRCSEYFDGLPDGDRPRYILVSDFQTLELHAFDEREAVALPFADLATHVEVFRFIVGVQRRAFRDQDPANIEAAEADRAAARCAGGHGAPGLGDDLERFLVRIVLCMFAYDIVARTGEDGSDELAEPMFPNLYLGTPLSSGDCRRVSR